ncbi:hypothetical protein HHI36_012534 [Cryptolaemus montrouzieri]|uniref:Uncharacterized protein n=1 Tax=Cryptolaemus montrouzieri TaxID=559131 RepID=A0ABD2NEK2_9CUCU
MIQTVSVSASGPAFSFLLYESLKNEFCQEGFLLGDIIEKETKTITDNDQQQTYNTKVIKINAVVPCPRTSYFYNSVGKINEAKLKSFLGNNFGKVVAWYKYKPLSSFKLMFREKLIHKQLSDFFNIAQDSFSMCLLISDCTINGSTHSFQQSFLRNKNNRFEPLPFHIVNLTDKKNCYKSAELPSASFQGIINKLKLDPKTSQGVTFITRLQQSVQEHVESVIEDLAVEEETLFNLEEEIRHLLMNKEDNEKEIIKELSDSELFQEEVEQMKETIKRDRKKKGKQACAK